MSTTSSSSKSLRTRQKLPFPTPTNSTANAGDSDEDLLDIVSSDELDQDSGAGTAKPLSVSPISLTGCSVASGSSSKENVAPGKRKSSGSSSRKNNVVMSYSTKKRRASGSKGGRGRRPSAASSTVSDKKSVVSVNSTTEEQSKTEEREEVAGVDSSDDDEQGEGVYTVERIDDKQEIDGKMFYFIKWKGWSETANTWEPVENLEGCPELLEAFEKRQAEKKKLAPKRRLTGNRRKNSFCEDDVIENTQKNMHCYAILEEWPADKEPISVEGVISVDGSMTYVVKKQARLGSKHLDRTNAVLVRADGFRKWHPQLLIKYYESRLLWCDDGKDEKDKTEVAAQMSLLKINKGSKIGREITKDVDKKLAKGYSCGDTDPKHHETEEVEVPQAVAASATTSALECVNGPTRNTESEEETQLIIDVDENLRLEIENGGELDIMEVEDDDDCIEVDCVSNNKGTTDKFGLPEDINDSTTSCSTVGTDEGEEGTPPAKVNC